ncbi:MAG TPA: DUF5715 family protein [Longimicrobium sp.]|nr:DUF5715 family protein [Longimicrobium sp.]
MRKVISFALALSALSAAPAWAGGVPVTLRGSPASMERQNAVAKESDLSFVRTRAELRALEREGELVRLAGNADYTFAKGVSGPVARPELRTFVERLAEQYRDGCGERLVVTSLTRPSSRQPGNAHQLSVHPAGIAVDLRISKKAACRGWLEGTLLSLERRGVLDVTRERNPPHYHVALFPDAYRAYVGRLTSAEETKPAEKKRSVARTAPMGVASGFVPVPVPEEDEEERPGGWPALTALSLTVVAVATTRRRKRRMEDA